jgi:hypothetical protein
MLKPRGGKRENSGRKKMYDEETQSVSYAVPKSKIPQFRKNAKQFLTQFKKPKR